MVRVQAATGTAAVSGWFMNDLRNWSACSALDATLIIAVLSARMMRNNHEVVVM